MTNESLPRPANSFSGNITIIVASENLPRRRWPDRLSLWIHLLMCRHCRRYVRQLASIADALRGLYDEEPATDALEKSILDSLQKK